MRHRLARGVLTGAMLLASPALARAEDESKSYDARLEGYNGSVTLDSSSTALTWIFMLLLTAITVGVLLKDAKRTHLD